MTQVNFSTGLSNETTGDADQVMTLFNELKAGANSIDDTNVGPAGISESKIIFSSTGHNHNGVNSALAALAVNSGVQGTVKVRRVTVPAITDGQFTINLNEGSTAINNILSVKVLINTGATAGDGRAFHTAALPGTVTTANSYTTRYHGGSSGASTFGWYVIVNTATTPNEVFMFVDNLTYDAGNVASLVMLIGI